MVPVVFEALELVDHCSDGRSVEVEAEFQDLYFFPGEDTGGDEDAVFLVNDLLDLEPVVHDSVVLALPMQPVCQDDCPGLCSECGVRLADDPDHHHDAVDIRWAALQGLAGSPEDGEKDEMSGGVPRSAPADEKQEK